LIGPWNLYFKQGIPEILRCFEAETKKKMLFFGGTGV
jgi:hypothetical protein